MIIAVGIDIVQVARIERALARPGFLERILTEAERRNCTTSERIAGRWAAKEAVAKCLPGAVTWNDVEVLNRDSGAPYVRLSDSVRTEPGWNVHVSITHERKYAAAVAVLEQL